MTSAIQYAFPLWILLGGWLGWMFPETAAAGRGWIPEMLALIMLGMGLTLSAADVRSLRDAGRPLVTGICLQYLIMPLAAWLLCLALELPAELAIGVILVGAAPGGTASNVVTFLARGDVALSVAMTSASTLLAPVLTPLWVWLLASSWIDIQPLALFASVAKIILLPVLAGILIRRAWQPPQAFLEGWLPLASMLMIVWIVAVIIGLNHDSLPRLAAPVLLAVVLLNAAGLSLGYLAARHAGFSSRRRRAMAIEVGMQNSGLAVALAVAHFSPAAALAGAAFSLWHNLSGPALASWWRYRDASTGPR